MKDIDDSKAPVHSYFFKQAWGTIKEDIYLAVKKQFCQTGQLLQQWNCTSITLVPKVQNPSYVKEYRPIACCTGLYKLISNILTKRLAMVVGEAVNEAQGLTG